MAEQMNKKLLEEKENVEEENSKEEKSEEKSEMEELLETENNKSEQENEEENETDEKKTEDQEDKTTGIADSEVSDLKDVLPVKDEPQVENCIETLKPEPVEEIDDQEDLHEKPLNLVHIAGDILNKEKEEPSPVSLIKIASDIFNTAEQMKKQLMEEKKERLPEKHELSDSDKLEVIKNLMNILVDLRIEPQFPIPWLLSYSENIRKLNADTYLKGAFSRWAWNGLNDSKSDPDELANVAPDSMIQLASDVMADTESQEDVNKLADLIDRYTSNLNAANKLDVQTFEKLSSIVPKEKRNNFDQMTTTLLSLLEKGLFLSFNIP